MNWNILKKLIMANPMGLFIYAILSKWYIMMVVGGLVTAFWMFKGLEKAGVLDEAQKIVSRVLSESKSVAKYCMPLIINLKDFWHCLEHPPKYTPDTFERELNEQIEKTMKNNTIYDAQDKNPYSSDAKSP